MASRTLQPSELVRRVDPSSLAGALSDSTHGAVAPLAQQRALDALKFCVGMPFDGYNLYALGADQTGKRSVIMDALNEAASATDTPQDWCYINDFDELTKPRALCLPAGVGRRLRHDVNQFLNDATALLPAAFEAEEYQHQSQEIAAAFSERQVQERSRLDELAKSKGLSMLPTSHGFVFAPQLDGRVMELEEFEALPEAARKAVTDAIDELNKALLDHLRTLPQQQQAVLRQQRELADITARNVLESLLEDLRTGYRTHENVLNYLAAMSADLNENVDMLMQLADAANQSRLGPAHNELLHRRYGINLFVDATERSGAPVVYESNPSLENLIGRVDYRVESGNRTADVHLIKSGALQRANGGYLVLDVDRLLVKPFAWEGLKRALMDRSVKIESVGQLLDLSFTMSLEPEAIPLDVKVILLGPRLLYHRLRVYEPDFERLFKVVADFDDEIEWNDPNARSYAAVIDQLARDNDIGPVAAGGVARVLEFASRLVDDRNRFSTHVEEMTDLLREADYFRSANGDAAIEDEHVQRAIEDRTHRLDRIRDDIYEDIERGVTRIQISGTRVGQVNGLSVIQIGDLRFGQPSRITATARLGRGQVIDIERESKLGGKIHSKAVMIVASFIGARYARDKPLSLEATLVFEQSYGGVEGDSASVAEVLALLSALTDVPVRQSMAITGSMDQYGSVQAIGAINEKIEGFFDVCKRGELTGEQGVVIPESNLDNLMVRDDVAQAVADGRFHVHAIGGVDDAIELMLETPAGEDFDALVHRRIDELAVMGRDAQKADQ